MFHLQISQLRNLLQQQLIRQYGHEIAPHGHLLPAIEEALASLGSEYQIEVRVASSITASVQKEQPLKLSITPQPEERASSARVASPQISIWGVMAMAQGSEANRTLQPLLIEITTPGADALDKKVRDALNLLRQPGRSLASLAPQVEDGMLA